MPSQYVNVGTTATIIKSPQAGENSWIENTGGVTVYISSNSGVTTSTGLPLTPGSHIHLYQLFNITGATGGLYGITASGGTTVAVNGICT